MDQWRPVTRLLCLAPATHFETIGGEVEVGLKETHMFGLVEVITLSGTEVLSALPLFVSTPTTSLAFLLLPFLLLSFSFRSSHRT